MQYITTSCVHFTKCMIYLYSTRQLTAALLFYRLLEHIREKLYSVVYWYDYIYISPDEPGAPQQCKQRQFESCTIPFVAKHACCIAFDSARYCGVQGCGPCLCRDALGLWQKTCLSNAKSRSVFFLAGSSCYYSHGSAVRTARVRGLYGTNRDKTTHNVQLVL